MTANFKMVRKNRRILLVLCVVLILSAIFTLSAKFCSSAAKEALEICAGSVIPSLFPFMVLSAIASSVASEISVKGKRVPALTAAILGSLCGFPVGASVTASMYKNGAISRRRAEYMAGFCNNTGPAFVVDVIGRSFWGDSSVGWIFYVCQILSSAIIFAVWRLFFRGNMDDSDRHATHNFDNCATSGVTARHSPADVFCNAISSSAAAVIRICGYIVFFYVSLRLIEVVLTQLRAPELLFAGISALLEFTTGTSVAAAIGGRIGALLCGFSLGFSGISVMAQSSGILTSAGLSSAPMLRLKLCEGFVCSALSVAAADIFVFASPTSAGICRALYPHPAALPSSISLSLIFLFVILQAARRTSSQNT